MTIDELRKNRLHIVVDALVAGVEIHYKHGWKIFISDNTLYQYTYSEDLKTSICHSSAIIFSDFLKFVSNINDDTLKDIYANTKLTILQKKLEDRPKEKPEKDDNAIE